MFFTNTMISFFGLRNHYWMIGNHLLIRFHLCYFVEFRMGIKPSFAHWKRFQQVEVGATWLQKPLLYWAPPTTKCGTNVHSQILYKFWSLPILFFFVPGPSKIFQKIIVTLKNYNWELWKRAFSPESQYKNKYCKLLQKFLIFRTYRANQLSSLRHYLNQDCFFISFILINLLFILTLQEHFCLSQNPASPLDRIFAVLFPRMNHYPKLFQAFFLHEKELLVCNLIDNFEKSIQDVHIDFDVKFNSLIWHRTTKREIIFLKFNLFVIINVLNKTCCTEPINTFIIYALFFRKQKLVRFNQLWGYYQLNYISIYLRLFNLFLEYFGFTIVSLYVVRPLWLKVLN